MRASVPFPSLPHQEEHRLALLNMTPGDLHNLFDEEDDDEMTQTKNGSGSSNINEDGRGDPDPGLDRPTAGGNSDGASARKPHRRSSLGEGGFSTKREDGPGSDGSNGGTPATSLPALLAKAGNAYLGCGGGRDDAAEPSRMRKSSISRSKEQQDGAATSSDAEEKGDEPRGGGGVGGENGEHEMPETEGRHGGEKGVEVTTEKGEGSSDEAEENCHEQRRESSDSQPARPKRFGPIVMNCSQVRRFVSLGHCAAVPGDSWCSFCRLARLSVGRVHPLRNHQSTRLWLK